MNSRPTPRNYLGAAEEKLQRGEVRASTAAGRLAFEQMLTAVWKDLEKSNNGTIALELGGPKAHVEQGKLACSLRKRLKEVQQRSHQPRIAELVDGYDFVLDQRNYRLLNIAAHEGEDIEDIDPNQAKDMLDALKRMDACLRSR